MMPATMPHASSLVCRHFPLETIRVDSEVACAIDIDIDYDIEIQCRNCFENVKTVVEDSGVPWTNVIDVQAFLTNMKDDFATYNRV